MGEQQHEPRVAFLYSINVGGKIAGYFAEISGLENAEIEHRALGGRKRRLTEFGRLTCADITLKRGIARDVDLWSWRKLAAEGKADDARATASILMYDDAGGVIAEWDVDSAWPSSISPSPKFSTVGEPGPAFVIDHMTLVCEGVHQIHPANTSLNSASEPPWAALVKKAIEVLGSAEGASEWLREPNDALGGEAPTNLAARGESEKALILLERLEAGVYS